MNSRKTSKTNIKLPKITSSPSKSSQHSKSRPQKQEDNSPFTAAAYAVYTADLRPVICTSLLN